MRVLTIDPGTNCGWAYRDGEGRPDGGVQVFDLMRGESPGMRFVRFNVWLRRFAIGPGDLVLFEQPPYLKSGAAVDLLVGMTTRIAEFAAERGAEHKAVGASTLKKHVGGKGNASPDTMRAAVGKWLDGGKPLAMLSFDEIIALALLAWYDAGMPEPARKPRKKRQLDKVEV